MRTTRIYLLSLVTILLFSVNPYKAEASHASAGEIVYEWVADSTYRFFFIFYRDCTGIQEGVQQPLCFKNTCNNTDFTVMLDKWNVPSNGDTLPAPCMGTKCGNSLSNVPGFRKWIYQKLVTMPSQCSAWKIYTYVSDRNPSVNLSNATAQTFYVETFMNNQGIYQGNTSPYFSINPLPYRCVNQGTVFNNGAVDVDGDSLATELIMPQVGINSCSSTPVNGTYVSTSPGYNITSNPLQTNNTFTLQKSTGMMTFFPTLVGSAAMAIRVDEYRNGIKIGSVIREMEMQILPCVGTPYPPPSIVLIPGNNISNGTVYGCPGLPLNFCFYSKSQNTNAVLKVSDNSGNVIPGSWVNYSPMNVDSVAGCFSWTPPLSTYGTFTLTIVSVDSTCNGNLPLYSMLNVPISIGKIPSITIAAAPGTTVSQGTPVTFTATSAKCNSGTYQWKVNGVAVNGATNATWLTSTIANNDIITCALHCNDSCASVRDTASNSITMHITTSVAGMNSFKAGSIYPNPNNGEFTMNGYVMKAGSMQLEVLNTVGQTVYKKSLQTKEGLFEHKFSVIGLPAGLYLLRLKVEDGTQVMPFTISK